MDVKEMLDNSYPCIFTKEEDDNIWAEIKEKYSYLGCSDAEWDALHISLVEKYIKEEKLVIV